ncbi:MAG: M42 family metallopeptidase, partial [Armatimonadota bacterium]
FVKFVPLGGWWDQVVLAQPVVIQTQKGLVRGIVGSKPPHLLEDEERNKVQKLKSMFIDVGARDEKEATSKFGIRPGDPIVPWSPFHRLSNRKLLAGKAFDDRVGVAMFVEALKALKGKKHANIVYGVGTVQEEVGLRGAQTSAHAVEPDVALVMEVAIAGDVPGIAEEESQVKLGKGPAIYLLEGSAIPNLRLRELALEICAKKKIPYSVSLMPRGGTDAGRIHVHARGVPSLVIGAPTRHIHSHTGIMHSDDFDNAVKLIVELVKRLDAKTVAGLVA